MSYSVYPTPYFKRLLKRLAKKHPSLKDDLRGLVKVLREQPDSGIHLGHGIHKVRMAIASKGQGKSGGARVITYLVTENSEVYLVYIYEKSQLDNITKEQIMTLVKKAGLIE